MPCVHSPRLQTIIAAFVIVASTSCTALRLAMRGGVIQFRPPSIALAYPADGSPLPADKPLVVFRFEPGQGDDPIDPGAFRATVDGVDHTARFRVSASEAWGQLGDSSAAAGLTPGSHLIGARVCSVRGACGLVSARVEVRPWDRLLEPPRNLGSRTSAAPNGGQSVSTTNRGAGHDRPRRPLDHTGV